MSSSQPSANIPLHSLSASHRRYEFGSDDGSLLATEEEEGEKRRASSQSSQSSQSDFSVFNESETGDLADQLDDEDPLHIRLRNSLQQELPKGQRSKGGSSGRPHKSVRYHAHINGHSSGYSEKTRRGRLRKEDIPIPNPPRKPLSFGHRLLAAVMAPGDGPSRIHGLHGKKLMQVWKRTKCLFSVLTSA